MTVDINTEWLSWQTTEWYSWLANEIEKRKTVFLTDPDQMKQAFNQEKSAARDYYGRELLELIQNADDAGAEQDENNRILIELDDQILYVANTGKPFSPAGIKSLMVSDNSPKQLSRTRFIGYKGLGFRSILGWASEIAIFSGKLEVGFTEEEAIRTAKDLGDRNSDIAWLNNQFLTETQTYPMAILSCPFWINGYHTSNPLFQTMTQRCQSIISEGYDTCIGFILKTPESTRDKVISQISSLGKELLIFSNFLEEVNIHSKEIHIKWQAIRQDNKVIVSSGNDETSLWEIIQKIGLVPAKYIGPGQPKEMSYEIKVAIPDDGKGKNFLYVYFPTQVRFPFPVVAHATFELASNRQHIIESDVNRFLCSELAAVMGEAAECSVDPGRPWKALSIISPTSAIDPVLEIMDFNKKLISICSKNKIIPVRQNKFLESSPAKNIKGDFDDLLSGETFSDLVLWTDNTNIQEQMENLGVGNISQPDLMDRINKISSSFSIEKRASLIKNFVDNEIFSEEFSPSLLTDMQGEIIPKRISPFLPPEGQMFSLPDWAPPRFVHGELVEVLRKQFGLSRVRDLATKLKIFRVQEYNFASILQSIVAETNRRVQALPENELQIRKEMLKAIWNLYKTRVGDDTTSTVQRVTYIVPTRAGTFSPAEGLYFGKEYTCGRLMEALLGATSIEKFIADPDGLGLDANKADLEPFLRWLGVTNLPRLQTQSFVSNTKYRDHVLSSLRYPVRFEEYSYKDIDEVRADYPMIRQVQNFDSIEDILNASDPCAILAWIALDGRIEKLRNEGDTNARVTVTPYKKQNPRYLQDSVIQSYPIWLFGRIEWLPTGAGKQPPVRCTIARGLPGEVSKIIGIPTIDTEAPIFKDHNIDRTAIARALLTIGVVNDINDLPWATYYQILQELPDIDPQGNYAKSLYRLFITRDDQGNPYDGKFKADFIRQGKMYGKHGDTPGYFPVDRLYYIDNFALFSHIESYFPLLELDKRRGGNKVYRLFNVKTLTAEELSKRLKVISYVSHPGAQDMKREIDLMKPFIYALRLDDDADRSELPSLKKLDIKLCRSVKAELTLDDRIEQIELKQGESLKEGDITYLVGEPEEYDQSFLRDPIIADAIGEIMSAVLRVNLSSDIAFLLTCKPSQRRALLDRMLGGPGEEKLIETRKLMEVPLEEEGQGLIYNPPPIIPGTSATKETTPTEGEKPSPLKPQPTPSFPPSAVGPVEVKPEEKIPIQAKVHKRLKIVRGPNPKPRQRTLTNADRAENLAINFEENQGRFPVKVSDIKGEEAYGCDILSFDSEDERAEFLKHPDVTKVIRFIEVKGSGISKGSITLKGNELKAANNYKNRFFLYRVFEDPEDRGIFELIELADPLGLEEEDALELEYEVHPYRTEAANKWSITEISENPEDEQE